MTINSSHFFGRGLEMSKRKKRLKKMQEVLLDASFISFFFYMNIVHIILAPKTNTFLILVVTQRSLRRETYKTAEHNS